MNLFTLLRESLLFAFSALRANPSRTLLSVFGIIMGIFCIIGIFTFVDALKREFMRTLSTFANPQRIIVEKFNWHFGDGQYPWWNYFRRPQPSYIEYQYLAEHVTHARALAVQLGPINTTTNYKGSSTQVEFAGVTHSYNELENLKIARGRFFSDFESENGRDVAVIGYQVAEDLMITNNPVGRMIKFRGRNYQVVGLMKKEGKSIFGATNDDFVYVPYKSASKVINTAGRPWWIQARILVDGYPEDEKVSNLEGELRMLMRGRRSLRPTDDDNFALNKALLAYEFVERIIALLATVGAIIGSFSIVVGGFNIANIMFISVQERTAQIGLQKALGAPRIFILLQFLSEAIALTIIGGGIGIFFVYLLTLSKMGGFDLSLTGFNVGLGLAICIITGMLAGLMPAYRATKLDPIEALRS